MACVFLRYDEVNESMKLLSATGIKGMTKSFRKKLSNCLVAVVVLLVAGCTSIHDSISTVKLDMETCSKLMAKGVECMSHNLPNRHTLAHVEYHQQLLPIYQRDDILSAELASANKKK